MYVISGSFWEAHMGMAMAGSFREMILIARWTVQSLHPTLPNIYKDISSFA